MSSLFPERLLDGGRDVGNRIRDRNEGIFVDFERIPAAEIRPRRSRRCPSDWPRARDRTRSTSAAPGTRPKTRTRSRGPRRSHALTARRRSVILACVVLASSTLYFTVTRPGIRDHSSFTASTSLPTGASATTGGMDPRRAAPRRRRRSRRRSPWPPSPPSAPTAPFRSPRRRPRGRVRRAPCRACAGPPRRSRAAGTSRPGPSRPPGGTRHRSGSRKRHRCLAASPR